MESALDELAALLRGEAREWYPQFRERLATLTQKTKGIGWGFHDFIVDAVGQLGGRIRRTLSDVKPSRLSPMAFRPAQRTIGFVIDGKSFCRHTQANTQFEIGGQVTTPSQATTLGPQAYRFSTASALPLRGGCWLNQR